MLVKKLAPILTVVMMLWPKVALAVSEFCDSKGHGASTADPWVNTALGCIPASPNGFVQAVFPMFFGVTGGLSFLLMVYGFILMALSSGDPKAVAGAQETVTSAIKGLLVSVFGIFVVRFLLLDVLKIPGVTN